ncbi:MAG: hypothetical protein MUO89_09660 [Dehalococcoidia bacterium]|nr:hypothetical protein [Dehalococcoidia bacterium]
MDNTDGKNEMKWEPKEIIDVGNGLRMGITSDDGYYIVLSPCREGSWKPANYIPPRMAKRLGELASFQLALANALN